MKGIIITIIAAMLLSCSANKRFVGKYGLYNSLSAEAFQFNSDSTFLGMYSAGHSTSYGKGTWKQGDNSTIILNSEIKNTNIPLKIKYSAPSSTDSIHVKMKFDIIGSLKSSDYRCIIFVDGKLFTKKDRWEILCDSLSDITLPAPVDSISIFLIKATENHIGIWMLRADLLKFETSLKSDVSIDVVTQDAYFHYLPFNNETIKVHKGYIRRLNKNNSKWYTIPKVSNRTDISFLH